MRTGWLLTCCFLFLLAGCHSAPSESRSVLCLVAASTREAVEDIGSEFTRETGVVVRVSADDSGKLANQIAFGAPADLYLSANLQWADFVKEKGLQLDRVELLGNRLVLVVPVGNPGRVKGPNDLLRPEVKRVAVAGPNVPAGMYARQALKRQGVWDELEAQRKVAQGESVRTTLAYVERGEVEAGVVYATDAAAGKVQTVFPFEDEDHDRIVYPLVLLQPAKDNPAARQFFTYLRSPKAREVFERRGFRPLAAPGE